MTDLTSHYAIVVNFIRDGKLVPFLGAGANRCGRKGSPFGPTVAPPDGKELSRYLADKWGYDASQGDPEDLVRVAQYIAVHIDETTLYEELRKLFDVDYPTNPLHRLLAGLPALLREKAGVPHNQVVVTTNYDDLLERAFAQAGEQFDVFTYRNLSEGEQGRFWHLAPGATEAVPVESANDYKGLELDADGELLHPAILKIHGAINRANEDEDSYVITEDHYIDYLTHSADISSLVPANLMQKLTTSHFLFLGYSLRDWNVRAILRRIWDEQRRKKRKSWAIQLNPEEIEEKSWRERGAEIIDVELDTYVEGLEGRLAALTAAQPAGAG